MCRQFTGRCPVKRTKAKLALKGRKQKIKINNNEERKQNKPSLRGGIHQQNVIANPQG
jgi:hypothetical protein